VASAFLIPDHSISGSGMFLMRRTKLSLTLELMQSIANKLLPLHASLIDAVRKPPASKLRTTM
jgi:hypothetical protein